MKLFEARDFDSRAMYLPQECADIANAKFDFAFMQLQIRAIVKEVVRDRLQEILEDMIKSRESEGQ